MFPYVVVKKSVKLVSKMFLSLGSNLGNRLENLAAALVELNKQNISIVSVSNVYETSPVDCSDNSPAFLNAAAKIKTVLKPSKLISIILDTEKKIGRKRSTLNAPRIIDIDILLCENLISNDKKIVLPHPRMCERLFVLAPLREIAAETIHPVLEKSISQIYSDAQKTSTEKIKIFAPPFSILPV